MPHEEILRHVREFVSNTPVNKAAVVIVGGGKVCLIRIHVYGDYVFIRVVGDGLSIAPVACLLNQSEFNFLVGAESEAVSLLHQVERRVSPPAVEPVEDFLAVIVEEIICRQGDMNRDALLGREREVVIVWNVFQSGKVFADNFCSYPNGIVACVPTVNRAGVGVVEDNAAFFAQESFGVARRRAVGNHVVDNLFNGVEVRTVPNCLVEL